MTQNIWIKINRFWVDLRFKRSVGGGSKNTPKLHGIGEIFLRLFFQYRAILTTVDTQIIAFFAGQVFFTAVYYSPVCYRSVPSRT
ncbi:hypothetical protein MPK67_gp224 [Erwinia phage pEa_SNUABM_32]|uniref:Uncharacterized protein n=1 Tax=Erwinia phage pEa_SNUABM_32 TaxID=2869555 RepID=A0AAE7XIZ6_9CAUD|nr:hypothetical protein MPK67_gp224 [Erwinia phage pEa_SNUABM_32]QZE57097.1 hypothetical protein pEaSNUABM32_00224 [Erwinia phage pEa_SNUABM_32]